MQTKPTWHMEHVIPHWRTPINTATDINLPPDLQTRGVISSKGCSMLNIVGKGSLERNQTQHVQTQMLKSRTVLSCSWCCDPKPAPQTLTNQSLRSNNRDRYSMHRSLLDSQSRVEGWCTKQGDWVLVCISEHLRMTPPGGHKTDFGWSEWTELAPAELGGGIGRGESP